MKIEIKRLTATLGFITGLILLSFIVTQAQPRGMSVEERVKTLKDSLNLTEGQVTKITKILEDQREEMTTSMKENREKREEMRSIMQERMKKTNTQIKTILSKEQILKYEEMLKARRDKIGKRMRGGDKK